VLASAITLPVPRRPPGWPVHLDADGGELATMILEEFGVGLRA
jgi:hypothetical protein